MKLDSFRTIVQVLEHHRVRYLIAGGLAVNVYGYLRFTKDIDLILELVPENLSAAFNGLQRLGYHPIIDVTFEQIASPEIRETWIREKGMQVLQLISDVHRETPIDLFMNIPFDFTTEFELSRQIPVAGLRPIHVVQLETLLKMKSLAGRPQDMDDIAHLKLIRDNPNKD